MTASGVAAAVRRLARRIDRATAVAHPDVVAALAARWADLPEGARTPSQLIGQRVVGCEGTHGVFPRCNLACRPCYHSRDANRIRIDADHTAVQVDRQMAYLRRRHGPGQHAQLIGGEVTLLGPEAHARALAIMRRHGRKPMSMSHGDFDYDYLVRLAIDDDGRPRFPIISFAVHIDSTMRGRRAVPRPASEAELNDERARVCAMFRRLKLEHGVRSYLAHNMTVTPHNVDQVADVLRDCRAMGFRMFSFQPAAAVGDPRRWTASMRSIAPDDVWREIERGMAMRLPHTALEMGDPRCNRVVWGFRVGNRYVPVLDDGDPRDLAARDLLIDALPGMDFAAPRARVAAQLARAAVTHPRAIPTTAAWAQRRLQAAGLRELVAHGAHPLTIVMHSFMDARTVVPAWDLLEQGITSDDPAIRAAQERLQTCAYLMAHPDSDRLVPACAQHAVFDPDENAALRQLLPRANAAGACSAPG